MRTATRCGGPVSKSSCRRRSSSCSGTSWATQTGCCPRCRYSTTCGTTTSAATPGLSSRTSPCCGARSIPPSRTCCTRCAASVTSCGSHRLRPGSLMSRSASQGGFWRSVRRLPGRTPLRLKLITAVLALAAIALAVVSVAGLSVLRGYLLGQADDRLEALSGSAQNTVLDYLSGGQRGVENVAEVAWIPAGGRLHTVDDYGTVPGFGRGAMQVRPGPAVPTSPT